MTTRGLVVVVVLLLSGLMECRSFATLRRYHRVDDTMTWSDARRYCREEFTDLAIIESRAADAEAKREGGGRTLWIGLHGSTWEWSSGAGLTPGSFYTNWGRSQPSFWECVMVDGSGLWYSRDCDDKRDFLCDTESGSGVLVKSPMSWTDARAHCRRHHKDLSAIVKEETNRQLQGILNNSTTTAPAGPFDQNQDDKYQINPTPCAWFGLFRPRWEWSDGSPASYRNWQAVQAQKESECVAMVSTRAEWVQHPCNNRYAFLCYSEVNVSVVRAVKLHLSSSAALTQWAEPESVLQQVRQKLAERGVGEDVKLSWRTQPDGRIFHREQEEEEEEQSASC